jgi:hypothetical protein
MWKRLDKSSKLSNEPGALAVTNSPSLALRTYLTEETMNMKGPGHSKRCDVRRVWECPVCQKRVKTGGNIVHLRCEACARNKTGDTAWMRLLEPRRQSRTVYPHITESGDSGENKKGVETRADDSDANLLPKLG